MIRAACYPPNPSPDIGTVGCIAASEHVLFLYVLYGDIVWHHATACAHTRDMRYSRSHIPKVDYTASAYWPLAVVCGIK